VTHAPAGTGSQTFQGFHVSSPTTSDLRSGITEPMDLLIVATGSFLESFLVNLLQLEGLM
jgi:hypothetical protein